MSWHGLRHLVGASLIVAAMLVAGCSATVPSFQPGASLPDLPSRPTDKPTDKPPAEQTDKPPAEKTEKPPAEQTEKPPADTENPPAEKTEKPTEKPPADTEKPTAEPTASPAAGSGDSTSGTSPGLILLVVVLAIGLAVALYALYRKRNE